MHAERPRRLASTTTTSHKRTYLADVTWCRLLLGEDMYMVVGADQACNFEGAICLCNSPARGVAGSRQGVAARVGTA
jgi:hypothetical protein